jgi:hypothetical protein
MCDTRYAKKSQIANRKSSIEHRASSIENRKSHIAWHLCLVLILLMYGLLFLFRSYIPEPWTALIAVGLLVVYRILRYWLHPMVKRTRLINSSNS